MEANKKKIAAMGAVLYYLQAEQAALEHGTALLEKVPPPASLEGFWSYSGRQSQMMYRNMVQMRQIPGWNK
jgi:hypothetical protein